VPKRRWIDLLYAGGALLGFLAPPGADPQADLTAWRDMTTQDPEGEGVKDLAATLTRYLGGGVGIPGTPAPLIMANGWSDEVFPGDEALRTAKRAAREGSAASVLLGDFGHGWAANPAAIDREFNDAGAAFLASALEGTPVSYVTVARSTCPDGTAGVQYTRDSLADLRNDTLRLKRRKADRVTSEGSAQSVADAIDGATAESWCDRVRLRKRNTVRAQTRSDGETLIGAPTVRARIDVVEGDTAQLAARLWDVDGNRGRLIARGVARIREDQRKLRLQLHPNAYRFAEGNRILLELVGADAPYAQAPGDFFRVKVRNLRVSLPVR
jgi:hypothetical protein